MLVNVVSTTQGRSRPGFLLLGLALACSPASAPAETIDTLGGRLPFPNGAKCFGQTFDENHLRAHPTQRITSIFVLVSALEDKYSPKNNYEYWPYMVVVRLKGEKGAFWHGDSCEFENGVLRCPVVCDGGDFTLSAPETGAGLRLDLGTHYVLQGGCGDHRKDMVLSNRTEMPTYHLDAQALKVCASAVPASRKAREWLKDLMPNAQERPKNIAK